MANSLHGYTTQSGAITLTAATARTPIQLQTPSDRLAQIIEIAGSFPSTTATHSPVLVELLVQTTAGSGSSAATPAATAAIPAAKVTAITGPTTEPTAGTVLLAFTITPVGGTFIRPLSRPILIPVSTRVGLRVTAPETQTGCRFEITHEE